MSQTLIRLENVEQTSEIYFLPEISRNSLKPSNFFPVTFSYRLLIVYAIAFIFIGLAETYPMVLLTLFEDQCHVRLAPTGILIGTTIGYFVGTFFIGWIQYHFEDDNLLKIKTKFLGLFQCQSHFTIFILALLMPGACYLIPNTNSIWIVIISWCYIYFISGVIESGLATYLFRMTQDLKYNTTDGTLAAMLLQALYVIYGIGSTSASLLIELSDKLWNSYNNAMYLLGIISWLIGLLLLCSKPPSLSTTSEKTIKTKTYNPKNSSNNSHISDILEKSMMLTSDQSIFHSASRADIANDHTMGHYNNFYYKKDKPMTISIPDNSLPINEKDNNATKIKTWKYIVVGLSAFSTFSTGGLQFALNSFISDFVYEHLNHPKSIGRYLNSTYFAAQLCGRFGTMFAMKKQYQTSNILLWCNGMMTAAMAIFVMCHDHMAALYVSFALTGWFAASVIASSLKFANDIIGNNGFVSALYFASFGTGSTVVIFIIDWGIEIYDYIFFPWVCFVLMLINIIIYILCWSIYKIYSTKEAKHELKQKFYHHHHHQSTAISSCISPM